MFVGVWDGAGAEKPGDAAAVERAPGPASRGVGRSASCGSGLWWIHAAGVGGRRRADRCALVGSRRGNPASIEREGTASNPAQRAGIRRLHCGKHCKAGTIAAQLGVHRETVRAVVEHESGGVRRGVCRSIAIDLCRTFIGDTLAQCPRQRAPQIDLVRRRGYPSSVVQVHRLAERLRLESGRAVYRQMVIQQPPVDWGAFSKVRLGHGVRSVFGRVMFLVCLCVSSWSAAVENGPYVGVCLFVWRDAVVTPHGAGSGGPGPGLPAGQRPAVAGRAGGRGRSRAWSRRSPSGILEAAAGELVIVE